MDHPLIIHRYLLLIHKEFIDLQGVSMHMFDNFLNIWPSVGGHWGILKKLMVNILTFLVTVGMLWGDLREFRG